MLMEIRKTVSVRGEEPARASRTMRTLRKRKSRYKSDIAQCMITLFHDQVIWLDRLTIAIRSKSKKAINRGAVVRSLIEAVIESDLKLNKSKSAEEIKERIKERIKHDQ